MSLLVPSNAASPHLPVASPETHPLQYLNLDLVRLSPGETYSGDTGGRELGLVVLGGQVDLKAGAETHKGLGERPNVFAGRATTVYAPPGTPFEVTGAGEVGCELALCYAKADAGGPVTVVRPSHGLSGHGGAANSARRVEDVLATAQPTVLQLGETTNPPGNWSSYPPHKHDTAVPGQEVVLEEIYHYRLSPRQGFGVQCIYTADRELDEAVIVRDGDTVVIPKGYHPVVAGPGYRLYYLWMLAGPRRLMQPNDDPDHAWVKAVEPMLRS